MKSFALALIVALSAVAAGSLTANADTFTVHGTFGGDGYGSR